MNLSFSLLCSLASFPLRNNQGSFMNLLTHQTRSSYKDKLDSVEYEYLEKKAKYTPINWLTNPN